MKKVFIWICCLSILVSSFTAATMAVNAETKTSDGKAINESNDISNSYSEYAKKSELENSTSDITIQAVKYSESKGA